MHVYILHACTSFIIMINVIKLVAMGHIYVRDGLVLCCLQYPNSMLKLQRLRVHDPNAVEECLCYPTPQMG